MRVFIFSFFLFLFSLNSYSAQKSPKEPAQPSTESEWDRNMRLGRTWDLGLPGKPAWRTFLEGTPSPTHQSRNKHSRRRVKKKWVPLEMKNFLPQGKEETPPKQTFEDYFVQVQDKGTRQTYAQMIEKEPHRAELVRILFMVRVERDPATVKSYSFTLNHFMRTCTSARGLHFKHAKNLFGAYTLDQKALTSLSYRSYEEQKAILRELKQDPKNNPSSFVVSACQKFRSSHS